MDKVLLIGAINRDQVPTGGQEAKNQILIQWLNQKADLRVIDTKSWKKKPWILFRILFSILKHQDHIILSLSSLSAFRVIQLLKFFDRQEKTIYLVVGGWFPDMLKENPRKVKWYHSLKWIYVQSHSMVESLKALGLSNSGYLPNFKFIDLELAQWIPKVSVGSKKFLYLSRIDEEKGARLVIEAIEALNHEGIFPELSVDFYGYVREDFRPYFMDKVESLPYIHYKGVIDLRDKQNYLELAQEGYYGFLFCSSYIGEGFPGAILDAMILGIPVIASDWNFNKEVVRDKTDGLIVPPKSVEELKDAIHFFVRNPERVREMALNIKKNSANYDADKVLENLMNGL